MPRYWASPVRYGPVTIHRTAAVIWSGVGEDAVVAVQALPQYSRWMRAACRTGPPRSTNRAVPGAGTAPARGAAPVCSNARTAIPTPAASLRRLARARCDSAGTRERPPTPSATARRCDVGMSVPFWVSEQLVGAAGE